MLVFLDGQDTVQWSSSAKQWVQNAFLRFSIGKSCRSQAERLKILSPSFLRGSIECFPGGSILNNIKFSQWLNIAQQKVFQVAHSSTLLEIRVPLTEGDTIFCLNVTALNKGALYEPSLNHS